MLAVRQSVKVREHVLNIYLFHTNFYLPSFVYWDSRMPI